MYAEPQSTASCPHHRRRRQPQPALSKSFASPARTPKPGTAMPNASETPTLLTLDDLASRWRCTPKTAIDDAFRHNIPLVVMSRGWLIEWGDWIETGATNSDVARPIREIAQAPIATERPNAAGNVDAPRNDTGWRPFLGPRTVNEFVGLFEHDVSRLLAEPSKPIALREVHGTPLGMTRCGRIDSLGETKITLDDIRVRSKDVEHFERTLQPESQAAVDARRSRELLELIADADIDGHSPELALAIRAWDAVVRRREPTNWRALTPKQQFRGWLEANSPGFGPAALERIATLLNPAPTGGRARGS